MRIERACARTTSSISCCTWAISSTRSSSIRKSVKTCYDRTIHDVVRFTNTAKSAQIFMCRDGDGLSRHLQSLSARSRHAGCARRWPFVTMWDNHEFSWQGWQSILQKAENLEPGQTRQGRRQAGLVRISTRRACTKVSGLARNIRSARREERRNREVGRERPRRPSRTTWPRSTASSAIALALRQAPRPDHHRSAQLSQRRPVQRSGDGQVRTGVHGCFPEERADSRRRPRPSTAAIRRPKSDSATRASPIRRAMHRRRPCSAPSRRRGSWTSCSSKATWKIWGNSQGALDSRADPQNLPDGMTKQNVAGRDLCSARQRRLRHAPTDERGEIYDLVRDAKITGFAIVSGDRHSFWAG